MERMSETPGNAMNPPAATRGASPAVPAPQPHRENPAPVLRAAFERIWHTRMADLPILNPDMEVDTVGWRAWQGEWLGVLVTPWSINLMLLPGEGGNVRPLAVDERQTWSFPSGHYDFMGGNEEGIGHYQTCSLFSPVLQFETQADAVNTALAAIRALMEAEPDPRAGSQAAAEQLERARAEGKSVAERPMSRRTFLRGGR
ncbi:MAG: [NiFe]-hydrogenase assembly chaperone HybE [Rhodocyclaceae bacterium]|nr:[NiFe]-hydrogenase assembly chaperone HybE [Rhodocyclaceae bacterium]